MSTENIYLLIVPKLRRQWSGKVRVGKISRKRPHVLPGQALVRLCINLPDDVLSPPTCFVEVKREHITAPTVKIESQPS